MNNLKDIHNLITELDTAERLFYQDFNEQFEGYTQQWCGRLMTEFCCFIRISMNNLKDIHNLAFLHMLREVLFYQDFNEQFEGYTQPNTMCSVTITCCFIRISMNNLKDIHNDCTVSHHFCHVVLSGFQWTIWRIYTTHNAMKKRNVQLFYQDFNEQFEGYTQHSLEPWLVFHVVLSGFQWTIWRIYTTVQGCFLCLLLLFYQDFNEQFEGYTQHLLWRSKQRYRCFIRISMNNLKDIHNLQ